MGHQLTLLDGLEGTSRFPARHDKSLSKGSTKPTTSALLPIGRDCKVYARERDIGNPRKRTAVSLTGSSAAVTVDSITTGDARSLMQTIDPQSVDLSFWSPPYHVGKAYEQGATFDDWQLLLSQVIAEHGRILRPGGFMAVNIGDILCFPDPDMPRFQADNIRRKVSPVTREDVMAMRKIHPDATRYKLAELLGCSEQTVQRRLEGNNVRGGKHECATKVLLTGCMVEKWAADAGLYLYDQRIWHKDPCWANSRWHSSSYRAVDEFEHIYVFWQPGIVEYDRERLADDEWSEWGSRGVWRIRSVRRNHRHEAEFPEELAHRVIKLYSAVGGTVLDPFVGSGTTTAVAKSLGRRWIGIDANECYAEAARERTDAIVT